MRIEAGLDARLKKAITIRSAVENYASSNWISQHDHRTTPTLKKIAINSAIICLSTPTRDLESFAKRIETRANQESFPDKATEPYDLIGNIESKFPSLDPLSKQSLLRQDLT